MKSIAAGIIFDQLPMPPSENQAYATDWKTGRRFTSKEMNEFKDRMKMWSLRRAIQLAPILEEIKWDLADHRRCIRVDTYMHFQYESLFTKAGPNEKPRRKKMDPSNKAKALYDALSLMLGIDDSRFIAGEVVPIVRTETSGQFVSVKLTYEMIQTDEAFKLPIMAAI